MHAERSLSAQRVVLASLLGLLALNALGGGVYGIAGAQGVPRALLAGSPFRSYLVPSLVLLLGVGGSLVGATLAVLTRADQARPLALGAGCVLVAWIAVQIALIGYVSWLQPAMAVAGACVVLLARGLPDSKALGGGERSFASYYVGIALRPRATFAALVGDGRRLRFGSLAMLGNAALYGLVYVFLCLGGGRPTVFVPWLAIPAESYYRWNVLFLAPSMLASWLLAAAVAQLSARALGGRGAFEDTLAVLGFGTAVASWWTLFHDLVTSFLGAVHVIDQRAYEDALSSTTPWAALLWVLMAGYLVAFVALFGAGIAAAHGLRRRPALGVGLVAFGAYQLLFCVFNR